MSAAEIAIRKANLTRTIACCQDAINRLCRSAEPPPRQGRPPKRKPATTASLQPARA